MKDYEIKKDEYKETWDKRKEFDSFEVACLSCNVTPSNYDKTEDKVKEKIDGMKGILDEINREREYKMKITIKERGGDPFCNIPASSFYFSRLQLHSLFKYNNIPKPLFLLSPAERDKQLESQHDKNIFPCKEGTKWEDITITLIADNMVRIKTPQGEDKYLYHQLGLSDRRKGDQPTLLWELLKLFLMNDGRISRRNKYDPKLPDTAKRLNRQLKNLFAIKDSIYAGHYKKEYAYKMRFKVSNATFLENPLK